MADTPLISFRLDKNIRDNFQRLYPFCLSRFLRKCILAAIKNRELFNQIYFSEE